MADATQKAVQQMNPNLDRRVQEVYATHQKLLEEFGKSESPLINAAIMEASSLLIQTDVRSYMVTYFILKGTFFPPNSGAAPSDAEQAGLIRSAANIHYIR